MLLKYLHPFKCGWPGLCAVPKSFIRSKGFTVLELVMVTGIIAILGVLTFPVLWGFLKQRDDAIEKATQTEIHQALQSYVINQGFLPDDTTNWAAELANFTNLSSAEIATDAWGNPRHYIMLRHNEVMLGQTIPIFYATVISSGRDGLATRAAGIAVENNQYEVSTDRDWWKRQANPSNAFAALTAGGDDVLLRFTDYKIKMNAYQVTLQRIQDITQALESYSRTKFAQALVANTPNANNLLYFPPARISNIKENGIGTDNDWLEYAIVVRNDIRKHTGGTNLIITINSNEARHEGMVNLMRALGLPASHCCSALQTYIDSNGKAQPMPFYYASNPRPRTATGCGARPNPLIGQAPLSPRISVRPSSDPQACY